MVFDNCPEQDFEEENEVCEEKMTTTNTDKINRLTEMYKEKLNKGLFSESVTLLREIYNLTINEQHKSIKKEIKNKYGQNEKQ